MKKLSQEDRRSVVRYVTISLIVSLLSLAILPLSPIGRLIAAVVNVIWLTFILPDGLRAFRILLSFVQGDLQKKWENSDPSRPPTRSDSP